MAESSSDAQACQASQDTACPWLPTGMQPCREQAQPGMLLPALSILPFRLYKPMSETCQKVKFPAVQGRGMCGELVLPLTAVLCSWGMQGVFAEGSRSPRAPVQGHSQSKSWTRAIPPFPGQSMAVPWCHICCPSWALLLCWPHCSLATSPSAPVFALWLWRCFSS